MKKVTLTIVLSVIFITPVTAEVIKCKLDSGKIVYQSTPCSSKAVSQKIVEIKKLTPRQLEEAQNKLKAWQAKQAANEAAKIEADKELNEEMDRHELIDAINRNAIATQRQTQTLERPNRSYYNGFYPNYYYGPQYYRPQSYGSGNDNFHHDHHKKHWDQTPSHQPQGNSATNRPSYSHGLRF